MVECTKYNKLKSIPQVAYKYFVAESINDLWKVFWFSKSDILKSHWLLLKNIILIYVIYGKTKFRFRYYATDPI